MSKRYTLRRLQSHIGTEIPADRLCRIWSGEHGAWWRPNSQGLTNHREAAGFYAVTDAIAIAKGCGPEKRLSFDVCWDYPIIFSARMIQALMVGNKLMTRRYAWTSCKTCKGHGDFVDHDNEPFEDCKRCRGKGKRKTVWQDVAPGDTIWCRENFRAGKGYDGLKPSELPTPDKTKINIWYEADAAVLLRIQNAGKLWPSIYLPRWASRMTLDVTATKMEYLQKISEQDAQSEGMPPPYLGDGDPPYENSACTVSRVMQFRNLWKELHGDASWDENPELVAMSFGVRHGNIDALRNAA